MDSITDSLIGDFSHYRSNVESEKISDPVVVGYTFDF